MIPVFPNFKKLEIEDREEINQIVCQYSPYSDYNFTSLWSWDVGGLVEWSRKDNFLIFKMRDYLTGEFFLSLIGSGNLAEILPQIFSYAKSNGLREEVRLVPEETLKSGSSQDFSSKFLIVEDTDNHDYIASAEAMARLDGSKFHNHRNLAKRFRREHPGFEVKKIDISDNTVADDVLTLFEKWTKSKKISEDQYTNELAALKKHIEFASTQDSKIHFMGLYSDGELIGFGSDEVLHNDFAVSHFQKAIPEYKGVYQFLWQESAKNLHQKGVKYFNMEQDLGIDGLRKSKTLWNPNFYLKKFIIRPFDTGLV